MPTRQGALAPGSGNLGSKNKAARSGLGRAALATVGIATALALSAASGTANAYPAGGDAKSAVATKAETNHHGESRGRIRVRPPARPRANASARIGLRPPVRNQPRGETQAAAAIAFPPLFGSPEVRSSNIGFFTKWTGALERATAEARGTWAACEPIYLGRCIGGAVWERFLVSLAGKAREEQIEAVNRYVNQAPYLPDLLNYGARDYWATPVELFTRGGDCEDYAIAKFVALRALGFSNSGLRLVVVQDLMRRRPHAVLAVIVNDRALVLDNQFPRIVPAEALGHYRPFYSINEENLWIHPA